MGRDRERDHTFRDREQERERENRNKFNDRDRDRDRDRLNERDSSRHQPERDEEGDDRHTKDLRAVREKEESDDGKANADSDAAPNEGNDMSEIEMMRAMGIPTGFESTQGAHVNDGWSNAS